MGTIRPNMEIRIQFGLQDYLRKTSFSEALKIAHNVNNQVNSKRAAA